MNVSSQCARLLGPGQGIVATRGEELHEAGCQRPEDDDGETPRNGARSHLFIFTREVNQSRFKTLRVVFMSLPDLRASPGPALLRRVDLTMTNINR